MLSQKLAVKSVQSLVMTKQLQQSFKILQMDTTELKDYLQSQIEENPFIEFPEGIDLQNKENFEDSKYESVQSKESNNSYREDYIGKIIDNQLTLKGHLLNQISIEINSPKERLIALRCTDSLDDNGYLKESVFEISKAFKCDSDDIQGVLNKLYKLDPIGAYAQNLSECLALQLKEQNIYDNVFEIILNSLKLVARGEVTKLIKNCKITMEEFKERMNIIKNLNPKPGKHFFTEVVQALIPDAYVFFDMHSNLLVKLNNNHLPSISLNSSLYKKSLENLRNKDELEFCKHKFHDAMFIARALEQRSQTLLQVVSAISEEQYEFFEKGINFLKPMTLSDIAQKVNLHESTISRISNKTIATTIGTFEIKYFFTSKIKSNITENIYSSAAIKNKIKEIIDNEHPQKVLADDNISLVLKSKGIDISRRTVTKYREAMRISSSHERKRLKSLQAEPLA